METEETYIIGPGGEKIYGAWYAKGNCNRCYGRGYSGINFLTKEKIMCSCMKFIKRIDPIIEEKPIEDVQVITSAKAGIGQIDV